MNRSPSIIVISVLLVLLAMRLVTAQPSSPTNVSRLVLSVSFIALAGLSVVAATGMWRRGQRALRLFVVWLIGYLAVGGMTQAISEGATMSEVAIWCVFVGALGLAVALHLRYVLRQAE